MRTGSPCAALGTLWSPGAGPSPAVLPGSHGPCLPGPGQHGSEAGAAVPGVPDHPGGTHGPAGQPQPQAQHGPAPALRHLRCGWAPCRPPGTPVPPPWHPPSHHIRLCDVPGPFPLSLFPACRPQPSAWLPPHCPPSGTVLAQGTQHPAEVSPEQPWGDPLPSPLPMILFWAWITGWGCHPCHDTLCPCSDGHHRHHQGDV